MDEPHILDYNCGAVGITPCDWDSIAMWLCDIEKTGAKEVVLRFHDFKMAKDGDFTEAEQIREAQKAAA